MRYLSKLSVLGTVLLLGACDDVVAPGRSGLSQTAHPEGFDSRRELRTGYILGPDGRPLHITYEVHDGRAIFEGDIDVGPADSIPTTPEPLLRAGGPRYGVVRSSSSYRWPSGVVPYAIHPSLPDQWRVTNAMAQIQATVAGVQFIPRTTESNYVYFIPGSGCSSPVGRVGGAQSITLDAGCTTGNAIHEIGHSLGMQHEHTRCDRDNFVTINTGNIQSGAGSNFTKQCSGHVDVFGYNEGSVMHYPTWAFGIGGSTTISSRRGLDHLMGQRNGLSQTDASTINWMYQPWAPQNVSVVEQSGYPLVSWSAANGATTYIIDVIQVYDYWNDWLGTHESSETTYSGGGSSSSPSIVDVHNPYTGTSVCTLYTNMYDSAQYSYVYEVVTIFPDGIVSYPRRWPAPIAPSSC